MFDGPQGLATQGQGLRACERLSGCVGKTPDLRPSLDRPFAGFICSSLDLFAALARAGVAISPRGYRGGVSEVYPGHIWQILANSVLPKKTTDEGRFARRCILEALGVSNLPSLPTHDENDACVAAVLASVADRAVPGLTPRGIGIPLAADPDGTLREGLMVVPEVSVRTRDRISKALSEPVIGEAARPNAGSASELLSGTTGMSAERRGENPRAPAPLAVASSSVRGCLDPRLDEIVEFLNDDQTRATYGAVAGVLGVPPISLGARLGRRRIEASWIVSASSGLPTGYGEREMHPALLSKAEVITNADEFRRRFASWKTGLT